MGKFKRIAIVLIAIVAVILAAIFIPKIGNETDVVVADDTTKNDSVQPAQVVEDSINVDSSKFEVASNVEEKAQVKNAKVEEEKTAIRAIVEKLPYSNISLEGWNGDVLLDKFNSPVWEELYKPCLACGTCTFVCPTCQCYDIKDYDTGHGVKRYRCWDSCMYSDFTMMAHGNNRNSQMQRFRQRFMHKLVYFPANNDGMYSCVGCGRCIEKCPSALNIVKVIKAFENQGGEN